MKKIFRIFLCAVISASCATQKKRQFETDLKQARCDEALKNIPEYEPTMKFLDTAQTGAGTVFSYAASGIGYTADVGIYAVGGAVMIAFFCWPGILAASTGSYAGGNGGCIAMPGFESLSFNHKPFPIGNSIYKSTKEWRCPDLTPVSRSVRRVAQCMEDKDTMENLKKAEISLESLYLNPDLRKCFDKTEFAELEKQWSRIRTKTAPPNL